MKGRFHTVVVDGAMMVITKPETRNPIHTSAWDCLLAWYESNGLDLDLIVDEGVTRIVHGELKVISLERLPVGTFVGIDIQSGELAKYHYWVRVNPLPEAVFA